MQKDKSDVNHVCMLVKLICHIESFVTSFEKLIKLYDIDPKALDQEFDQLPSPVKIHYDFMFGRSLPAYRIFKQKESIDIKCVVSDPVIIRFPINTSELLTILSLAIGGGRVIYDDYDPSKITLKDEKFLKYMESKKIKFTDFKIDRYNPELWQLLQ